METSYALFQLKKRAIMVPWCKEAEQKQKKGDRFEVYFESRTIRICWYIEWIVRKRGKSRILPGYLVSGTRNVQLPIMRW